MRSWPATTVSWANMRIDSLELSNFRCFRHTRVDLAADVVAIYGRNGVGKTALFDAIEFALFGRVRRLARFDSSLKPLRHVYAQEEDSSGVAVRTSDERWIRTSFGNNLHASVESSGGWSNHLDILYRVFADADFFPSRRRAESVEEMFRSTLLLSQDSIRRFVEGDPAERASVLATLAGSAHLLRCSEKAHAVADEALKRQRKNRAMESDASRRRGEADRALAERNARLAEMAASMAPGASTSPEELAACLSAAELVAPPVPTDPEDVDLFVTQLRATADERRRALQQLQESIARVAEGWDSHLARQRRIAELGSQLAQLREDLSRLEEAQSATEASITSLTERARASKGRAGSLQRLLEGRREERSLRAEDGRAVERLAAIRSRIDELQARRDQATAESDRLRAELAGIDAEIEALRTEDTAARSRLAAVEELARNAANLEARRDRLQEIVQRRAVREQEQAGQERVLGQAHEELATRELRIRQIQEAIDALTAATEGQRDLIAGLRAHVTGDICPLCGTQHESHEALLASIDRSLATAPPALKALVQELSEARRAVESLRAQEQDAESAVAAARAELSALAQEEERLTAQLGEIERLAAELELQPTSADVSAGAARARAAVTECETRTREATDRRSPVDASHTSNTQNSDEIRQALEQLQEEADLLDSRRSAIAEQLALALAAIERETALLPESEASDVGSSITTAQNELAAAEVERQEAERVLSSLREQAVENRRQQHVFEEDKAQLATAEAEYEDRCGHVGLAPDAELSDVLALQASATAKLESLGAADRALDHYRSGARRQALEHEVGELLPARDEAREQEASARAEIRRLSQAEEQARRWSDRLRDQVNSAIAQTAGRHQLRIERHFKSLIPSPHQFDRVSLDFVDRELVLGVRFRDRRHDAGEPRLFLSNAQANVLAIAIFLSLGAHKNWSRLETILLDDPVQHLDDLDAVAFLDTLRATALGRFGMKKQIVVSTCDRNLYLMMLKKFRPLESEGLVFRGVSLVNHGLSGPEVIYDHGAPHKAA